MASKCVGFKDKYFLSAETGFTLFHSCQRVLWDAPSLSQRGKHEQLNAILHVSTDLISYPIYLAHLDFCVQIISMYISNYILKVGLHMSIIAAHSM